jgi:hypothetical protein
VQALRLELRAGTVQRGRSLLEARRLLRARLALRVSIAALWVCLRPLATAQPHHFQAAVRNMNYALCAHGARSAQSPGLLFALSALLDSRPLQAARHVKRWSIRKSL